MNRSSTQGSRGQRQVGNEDEPAYARETTGRARNNHNISES